MGGKKRPSSQAALAAPAAEALVADDTRELDEYLSTVLSDAQFILKHKAFKGADAETPLPVAEGGASDTFADKKISSS
eukprot:13810314-Alexandrium_andersonii.AAC.1